MRSNSGDMKGPNEPAGIGVAVISAVAAFLGACLAKFFNLSIHEVERLAAFMLLVYGPVLIVRWVIHVRLHYLDFEGVGEEWSIRKRRKLRALTLIEGALALAATASGWHFFGAPGHLVQLGVTLLLVVAIWWVVEDTRETIEVDGPPCGADVIESCKPFRKVLDPKRLWNGKWGLDTLWDLITLKIPVGHRNKLAVFLVVGLLFSAATEAGAMIARRVSDAPARAIGIFHHPRRDSVQKSPKAQSEIAPALERSDPGPRSYVENCGTEVTPGDGLPDPLRADMKRIWESIGPAAGCAQRAHPNQSGGAFFVPGECQGQPWSLGVASFRYGAAILLENASAAAEQVATEAEIDGASTRADLASGDFQLLYSVFGPYLLIRAHKTDGHGGVGRAPTECGEIEEGKETYEILTPGMAEIFLRFNRGVEHAWPAAVDRDPGGGFDLVSAATGGVVAHAVCPSATECRLEDGDVELEATTADTGEVTVAAIEEYGPR